jgi:hypothetical protein
VLQLRDAVEKRNKELRTLEKRINEITDRIYKEFSKSVGVANIREYEENQLKDAQNLAEERLNLSSQLAKLKYQCVPSSLYLFIFSLIFIIISHVIGCNAIYVYTILPCICELASNLLVCVMLAAYYKTN